VNSICAAAAASAVLFLCGAVDGASIVSLDASRTGNEGEPGDDRFLTADSMVDATQILLDAGFSIFTTNLFIDANITDAAVLYTGSVDTDFTAQELTDIEAFVAAGGGLVVQRDWNDFYPAADPLAAVFGVTYGTDPVGPPIPRRVDKTMDHPIWSGPGGSVTEYLQQFSASVTGGTVIGDHQDGGGAISVVEHGLGRVVFMTDMDAWDSLGDTITPMPGNDNGIVWENIFAWTAPSPGAVPLLAIGLLGTRRRRRA